MATEVGPVEAVAERGGVDGVERAPNGERFHIMFRDGSVANLFSWAREIGAEPVALEEAVFENFRQAS